MYLFLLFQRLVSMCIYRKTIVIFESVHAFIASESARMLTASPSAIAR